jgi:hypothetical protein
MITKAIQARLLPRLLASGSGICPQITASTPFGRSQRRLGPKHRLRARPQTPSARGSAMLTRTLRRTKRESGRGRLFGTVACREDSTHTSSTKVFRHGRRGLRRRLCRCLVDSPQRLQGTVLLVRTSAYRAPPLARGRGRRLCPLGVVDSPKASGWDFWALSAGRSALVQVPKNFGGASRH